MLKTFFYAALFFLLASASYAEVTGDITIVADSISYSEDGSTLEAFGSVEVTGENLNIKTDQLVYNLRTKNISANRNITMMLKGSFILSAEYLDYNVREKKGFTKNVRISYRNSVLTGDSAYMDEEKIELRGATFNNCGLEPPHYHVYSYTTTLYPSEGWVIGYLGYLWVDGVPFVPVPAYIYDISVLGLAKGAQPRDVLSIPEVGSNDEDGVYERYTVPWIANKKLTGKVVFLNTEKGGLGGGVESNYDINDANDLFLRAYYDPRYNYYGGITHRYYFGPPLKIEKPSFYTFFKIKEQLLFDISTNVSYKERINYERVSMLPDVTLHSNDVPAFFNNFKIGGQVSYGRITEESSGYDYDRGNMQTWGYFDFPLSGIAQVHAGMNYDQSWYGFDSNWTRINQNVKFSRDFGYGFDSYASHMHYITYTGNSPFNYEMYHALPSDEFGVGLGYNFGVNRFTVDYLYYVPSWDPNDLDYGLSLGFHCYNLDIKYRATRKEMLLGVSLITR